MKQAIPQHKKMAMGEKVGFAKGGLVGKVKMPAMRAGALKTGMPDSPIEKAKRANGVPGMKKGGAVKC